MPVACDQARGRLVDGLSVFAPQPPGGCESGPAGSTAQQMADVEKEAAAAVEVCGIWCAPSL